MHYLITGENSPFGPMDVLVICASCLQASIFFNTASSKPDKCLCPSFNIDWRP